MAEIKISLKAARINAGMTQPQVAKALNKSVATIQSYESGRTIPTWDTVQQMTSLYGIDVDHLNFARTSV